MEADSRDNCRITDFYAFIARADEMHSFYNSNFNSGVPIKVKTAKMKPDTRKSKIAPKLDSVTAPKSFSFNDCIVGTDNKRKLSRTADRNDA